MAFLSKKAKLDKIDWNFPQAGTSADIVHKIHWFPGNFIPQIPSSLIQILSEPDDIVFDPFCGSGTTGIEASRLGRRAIISDQLRPCVAISKAKIALLGGALTNKTCESIVSQFTFDHECRSAQFGFGGEGGNPELSNWYSSDTLAQLRYIWLFLERQRGPLRDVLLAVFSDILFACASTGGSSTSTGKRRRHHWGWVADNVRPRTFVEHNAVQLFRDRLTALKGVVPDYLAGKRIEVCQQDARQTNLETGSVDLIVTSPPYVNMIDYSSANRLIYIWMNWEISLDRDCEIGARYRRSRKGAVPEYLAAMRACRDEMWRVLKHGGACALVVGASKASPNAATAVIEEWSERFDLIWGPTPRVPTRRRVSERNARHPVEFISVLRKP